MNYTPIPMLYGIVKNPHMRVIPENKLSDGLNIMFKEGKIQRREGYAEMGTNLPLNGAVTAFTWYEQLGTSNQWLLCFTERDSYKYDFTNGDWEYITKNYSTGTVTTSGGAYRTVTVTTGVFDDTNWTAEGCYEIKFGTTDMNGTGTPDTWYNVASVDSSTVLTLSEDGPEVTDSTFVLRLCWSGDIDNRHSVCTAIDGADRIVIVTNGVEDIQKWTGSGACTDLEGTPNKAKYLAHFGTVTGERLMLGWTIDTGVNQPNTIELSAVGDPEDWTTPNYYDLYNTNDEVKGLVPLMDHLVIYKEDSLSIAWMLGSNVNSLDIKQNAFNRGTFSINTVVDYGKFHIFFGNDKNVYLLDGINLMEISGDIKYELESDLNSEMANRSFAFPIREEGVYVLCIPTENDYPDKCYVYNLNEKTWTIWEYANQLTAVGKFKKDTSYTWAALEAAGTTWQQLYDSGLRWSDLIIVSEDVYTIVGDKDGYVYEYGNLAGDDNGTAITSSFITRDYPINDVKNAFKVLEVAVGLLQSGTGSVRIAVSTNFGGVWSEWITLTLADTGDFTEKIANFMRVGRQLRIKFENISGTYFELESMVIGWDNFGLTMRG